MGHSHQNFHFLIFHIFWQKCENNISDEKSELLSTDLGNILNWIEQLEEVDTKGIEPLASVNEHSLPWRKDVVIDGEINEQVLKNAPEIAGEFFVVPKVVE